MSTICERRQARSDLKRYQLQMGLPFSSRRTRVSLPRTTSRARMISASPCLIRDPVRRISSPGLKFTPISSRNTFGQRYTSNVSVPTLTSKWAISFSLPFAGSFTSCTVAFRSEVHAHIVQKHLRAEVYVECVCPDSYQQMGNLFFTTLCGQLHFLHRSFHLALGAEVVFRAIGFMRFLCNQRQSTDKGDEQKDRLANALR